MVVARFPPYVGGSELQAFHLGRQLSSQGIKVSVLTQQLSLKSPAQETLTGISVHRVALWAAGKPWESTAFILSVLGQLRELKPDVTHAHMLSSPAVAAAAARQLWGIPAIAKGSGVEAIGEMGSARASCLRRAKLAYLARHLNIVVSTVSLMGKEFTEQGFRKEQVRQIPNGVDTGRFRPADLAQRTELRRRLGLPPAARIALYTGRLSHEKGVDILIQAWKNPPVNSEHILLLLGDGPEKTTLQKTADSSVRWIGPVTTVEDYLRAADLFVLPSRGEALSNSLLEAMACGLPCVATRVGGTPEVIEAGRNGHLVAPEDPAALSASLRALLGDASTCAALGREARKTVEARYSLETVAHSYLQLYEELASPASR